MKTFFHSALFLALLWPVTTVDAKDFVVTSPDGHLKATVSDTESLTWSIERDGTTVLAPSTISITTSTGQWGSARCVRKAQQRQISQSLPAFAYKRAQVEEQCTEMTLQCQGDFNLVVRAYNDGVAYRLVSKSGKPLRVVGEKAEFSFADDYKAFVPYVNDNRGGERYSYSFESYYDEQKLSALFTDSIAITPLAVCLPEGMKAVVMETAVENYPGLFVKKSEQKAHTLTSELAPLPTETVIGGFDRLNLLPVRRADYIADLAPQQALPWRLVLVTTADTQLLDTDTPFCLAPACRLTDTS